MDNDKQQTPSDNQAGAQDGKQPDSVNQKPTNDSGAATGDDTVTLSKKDYDALLKQRDANGRKAGEAKTEAEKAAQRAAQNDALVNALVQKDAIRDAMRTEEFKEKYPDVTEDELLEANPMSDEEILEIAERKQQRYDKVKLDHVKKVQVASAPAISSEDRATKQAELKKPANKSRFQAALNLARMPSK